jgi:hypothetical protein
MTNLSNPSGFGPSNIEEYSTYKYTNTILVWITPPRRATIPSLPDASFHIWTRQVSPAVNMLPDAAHS